MEAVNISVIDVLVEQCRKPKGTIGKIMTNVMNVMDSGFTNWALEKIDSKDKKVLDVGCCGGETIYRLGNKLDSSYIEGIDYSEDAVIMALKKNRLAVEKGIVKIQQGEVSKLPFQNKVFDYVIAIRTHYFWSDLQGNLLWK